MGNRLNKIYEKAMDYYQKGNINKALEKCEKGIALDLKDEKLLNLKGMLLYLKGDLKGAVAVWKINSDYNNNEIAKIYIRDAKKDEETLRLYSLAEIDLKELRIDEALQKLQKCKESDFNTINVNNALAVCYLRKANYLKASECIEKSLNIDQDSKLALEVKKQINEYLEDPKEEFKRSLKRKFIALVIVLIGTVAVFMIFNNRNKAKEGVVEENKTENLLENKQDEVSTESFAIEEMVESEDVVMKLNSAEEVEKAYELAIELFDDKKYDEAIKELLVAHNSEVDTYYNKHILFLLASCYYEKNDFQQAINYYEEYIVKYDKTYIEEIYYKLALAYEEIDLLRSKEYATYIQKDYSKSMYNNSNIARIISR